MPAPSSDEALAIAFAAHDRSAFDRAYRAYAGLLYSAAYNVLANGQEAQDCVHDALVRIWRSPQAYSPARGALRSFLVVCVRNEAISRRRRHGRRMQMEERLAAQPPEHDQLPDSDPIERDRVRSALARLPVEQRVPLELAYYHDKTHREIASQLQQPLGTVKSRIAMGLRKLSQALQPAEPADRR